MVLGTFKIDFFLFAAINITSEHNILKSDAYWVKIGVPGLLKLLQFDIELFGQIRHALNNSAQALNCL